jgi:hypothetical protein
MFSPMSYVSELWRYCWLQVNLAKIDAGVQGLNERMSHEKAKLAEYSIALESLTARYGLAYNGVCLSWKTASHGKFLS